jgi:hypothetical protein
MLVAHISLSRVKHKGRWLTYASPLKRAVVDNEGTLRLAWWSGNDSLKGETRALSLPSCDAGKASKPILLNAPLNVVRGSMLEGTASFRAAGKHRELGLVIESEGGDMTAIRLLSAGAAEVGAIQADGGGFTPLRGQRIDRELPAKPVAQFRRLLRHSLVELYLDDVLLNVFSLPQAATGRVGYLNGGMAIGGVKCWTMALPDETPPRDLP